MFEAGLAGVAESAHFEEAGVETISNKPEEILDFTMEVDARMRGVWQCQLDDEELQQRFWAIYDRCSTVASVDEVRVRIGAAFLRKHEELLNLHC